MIRSHRSEAIAWHGNYSFNPSFIKMSLQKQIQIVFFFFIKEAGSPLNNSNWCENKVLYYIFFFASPYQQTQLSMIATRKHHCVLGLALEWFYLTMSYAIKKRQENRFFMKFCSLCDFLVLTVDTFIRGFILTRPVRKSNKSKKSHIFKFFEWKRLLWSFKRIPQVFEVLK